ncbi:peptidyl-Lys metalloendopeptidase [Tahibacter aquaticus]|uniref:Peptidyl-Lys metalloendopeptidase n=1 Tax=Tahibacter aquaticus TaxID=520092 RepID=A0A4R6Z2W2_9GAMM|nr:M35 family metallo-endopeptidase [Tahibacter aquaticus]TDR45864.1 peptidyl-Lys metalloendopeptidase [Tahibacter aquaticus]
MQKLYAGFAVLVLGMGSTMAANAAGIELSLSQSAEKDFGSGKIVYALSNTTAAPVQVLRWMTPLDGVSNDIFSVSQNGAPVAYTGRLVKRPAPTEADYVTIAPGQTVSVEVDLTAYYDMRKGGQYSVRYNRDGRQAIRAAAEASRGGVQAGVIDFDIAKGGSVDVFADAAADASDEGDSKAGAGILAATNSFVSCSTTRQNQIATARNSAATYANNSKSYLTAGTQGSRYTWWFGTYNSSRYSTVRTHFNNIYSALTTQPFTFDCSCTDSAYAYVYPNQPYRVYLCNAFWSAPNTGTDSKAGTIVHEVSHFTVMGGTDDWAYGQSAAHSLAGSNPARAVDNADSHEYFAENTPARN